MNLEIPRLRMFAGPNGSGKSTIKSIISEELLGIYINPDEIEKEKNHNVEEFYGTIKSPKNEIDEYLSSSKSNWE